MKKKELAQLLSPDLSHQPPEPILFDLKTINFLCLLSKKKPRSSAMRREDRIERLANSTFSERKGRNSS
jgi:hypothetical protein